MHPISQFLADVITSLSNKEEEPSALQDKIHLCYQEYKEKAAQVFPVNEEKEASLLELTPQRREQEGALQHIPERASLNEKEEFLRSLAKQRQATTLLKNRNQALQRKIDRINRQLEAQKGYLEALIMYEAFYTFVQQRYPLVEREYHTHEALKKFIAEKHNQAAADSGKESVEKLSKPAEEPSQGSSAL